LKTLILFALILLSECNQNPVWAMDLKTSWYSRADLIRDGQDKRTHFIMANGKEFRDEGLTCASWDYRLGDYIRVRNNANGKSVVVMVTDRTARRFKGKRVDLSRFAFSRIADCKQGVVSCTVEKL
jgi:rare lipoprotein A (peptidoglycan hydrolase)